MNAIKDLPHQARSSITFDRPSRDLALQDPARQREVSSSVGRIYRLRPERKPGFAIPPRHGKRER